MSTNLCLAVYEFLHTYRLTNKPPVFNYIGFLHFLYLYLLIFFSRLANNGVQNKENIFHPDSNKGK